jgi:molybdopterin biosynthesis enzyme
LLPVRLDVEQGRLIARRTGQEGSHWMKPMISADAFAIVPEASAPVEAGAVLEVLPFDRSRFGR